MDFTPLERAALQAIFREKPEIADKLLCQLEVADVLNRENSGCGFFTTISVPASTERVESPRVLSDQTFARIDGLKYGLGFVLFMEDGRLNLLEGYSCGDENTTALRLAELTFQIADIPT